MAGEALPIVDGWFAEKEAMWPGQRFCLQVKEVLHKEKSQYQDIMVFDSVTYGRVLILDGVIQLTERDEFAYQEMIAHLPMFAHPNPENVLIVGGGDGGVLREVARHKGVKKIVMCEIDERVVEVSKKFFGSSMATAYSDPRLDLHFMDAALYMKEHQNFFDVIIVDSSDPVGPAETLYTSDFYRDMWKALRGNGIVCTQGECMWLHLQLIERVMRDAKGLYPTVDYAYSSVPTYPDGQIGYVLASRNPAQLSLREPTRPVPADMASSLRYYTSAIHRAAFKLPQFAEVGLSKVRPASTAGDVTKADVALYAGVSVAAAAVAGFAGYFIARALRR